MVRLVHCLQEYGQYVIFSAVLLFGAFAFLNDSCAPRGDLSWSRDGFSWFADAIYRAAQLFVLEFNRACIEQPPPQDIDLEVARYAALVVSAATVVAFLVPRAARRVLLTIQTIGYRRRAIVLGYGPIGQAIAHELSTRVRPRPPVKQETAWSRLATWALNRRFVGAVDRWWRRGRFVTAIHKGIEPAHTEMARRDNVILVEGDPSDPAIHRRVRIDRSSCIFVAAGSDMQTLDATVSACNSLKKGAPHGVRMVLSDPDLAAGLPETASTGFLGATNVHAFSLATEAARLLVAQARFDRVAIEKGQERVHLVIIGCGAQGEAVAIETLLTAWRTALKAPVISIFDRDAAAVSSRFKQRAPSLFPETEKARLPDPAAARVDIKAADADRIDFGNDETLRGVLAEHGPATAWIFAAGDDPLNLRAAAALHTAILRRLLPPAPIHVRIWSGHQGDTPILSTYPIGIAKAFGALETTMAATPACDEDPDQIARELHAAYCDQGEKMHLIKPGLRFSDEAWDDLSETKRNANRRLHRHAVMKFEDLGGQWRHRDRMIPVVDAELREPYITTEELMNYDVMTDDKLPDDWWKRNIATPDDESAVRASKILAVAVAEHNRWTVDRALDGWRMTAGPDPSQRDDERRFHHNMHAWSKIDAATRRWDAVMLRALVEGDSGRDQELSAWTKRVTTLVLATKTAEIAPGSKVPVFEPRCRIIQDRTFSGDMDAPTEIRIVIAGEPAHAILEATTEDARRVFAALLAEPAITARLCRVRFDFHSHPGPEMLALANALGAVAAEWRSPQARDRGGSRSAQIEVSSLWNWTDSRRPQFGFVGHRDLSRTNGADGLAEFLEVFFAGQLARGEIGGLVSGYAPGADRIAVNSWLALGAPKPKLFFPFGRTEKDSEGKVHLVHLTDENATAGTSEWISDRDIRNLATVKTSQLRSALDAHRSQASDILDNSNVLVAVYDGAGKPEIGSAGDTVERARTLGKKVIIIDRATDGSWQHSDTESFQGKATAERRRRVRQR